MEGANTVKSTVDSKKERIVRDLNMNDPHIQMVHSIAVFIGSNNVLSIFYTISQAAMTFY
jgi:hypothetical protein